MITATMHGAKTQLSRHAAIIESEEQDAVVLPRGKKPVAQIGPYRGQAHAFSFGLAEGAFAVGDVDSCNDEIASLFYGA